MSESDYPLKPFVWPAADVRKSDTGSGSSAPQKGGAPCTPEQLLAYRKLLPDLPVETRTPDDLLAGMCEDQAGDPPDLLAMRARFRSLRDILPSLLPDAVVYRIGRVKIETFLVGTVDESGNLAGFETIQVET